MSVLWVVSLIKKNVSIVDLFWGAGFILLGFLYFFLTDSTFHRSLLVGVLLVVWGSRLSIYLTIRNWGKPEDFRYQQFRKDYGPNRYWWISYFQVFVLQGVLLWLISSPLLAVMYYTSDNALNFIDYFAIACWVIGFVFEAGGDYQLMRFKANPANKGKLLTTGLWKYTRHPNYFGDAMLWTSFGLFAVASGAYLPMLSSVLMTVLIIKVSGVSLLEKTLENTKPGYEEYMKNTNSFIPWFPKR